MYGLKIISYGSIYNFPPSTFAVKFLDNCLTSHVEVDERNLMFCEYINFSRSFIEKF